MEQKQETLRFLVTIHRSEFEKRRSYQWKAVAGIVTMLALIGAARVTDKTSAIISAVPDWLIWSSELGIALVASVFLLFVHTANAMNKEIAHRAEAALEKLINNETIEKIELYKSLPKLPTLKGIFTVGNGGYWGWLFESIVIFLFAVVSSLIVTT